MKSQIILIGISLFLLGCPKAPGVRDGGSNSKRIPEMSGDPRAYCSAHCPTMSDRDRFDFFAQHIWRGHVADWQGHLDEQGNAKGVTLSLPPSGQNWEAAATDAGMFAKVSPGVWRIVVTVTPKETVKQLADLASDAFKNTAGPGEALITGVLKAGTPRIEVTKK